MYQLGFSVLLQMANLNPGSPSTTLHEKHEAQTEVWKNPPPTTQPKQRGDTLSSDLINTTLLQVGSNKHNSLQRDMSKIDIWI